MKQDKVILHPIPNDPVNNGEITYNSTLNKFRKRENGIVSDLDNLGVGTNPSGNSGEIQYNNSGVFAGAPNVEISSTGNLQLTPITSNPATPSVNMELYPFNIADRLFLKWKGPSGIDVVVQPHEFFESNSIFRPGSSSTLTGIGNTLTTVGTITHPTLTATSLKNQTSRWLVTGAATAGSLASQRMGATECFRGSSANLGGFFVVIDFGFNTLQAGNRFFAGLQQGNAAPTNIDPLFDSTLQKVGVGFNTNTGNLFLINSGVTASAIDLGTNFPINNTNFYRLILFTAPFSSFISYNVINLTASLGLSSPIAAVGNLTTNIPANNIFLSRMIYMSNNTTAASVSYECSLLGLAKNY